MRFDFPAVARRSATLLAVTAIVGCDATRTVEAPVISSARPTPSAPAFNASGTGTSVVGATSVNVVNPSFESGLAGWSSPAGNAGQYIDVVQGWQASNGNTSLDMNGFEPGWVSQNIPTIAGVQYTVTFDMAGNPGYPQGVKTMDVSAAGTTATYSFNTSGKSQWNMGWAPQSFSFTATGSSTTLMFKSTYQGNAYYYGWVDPAQGPALDNVQVTWVPTATTTTVSFGSGPFIYTGSAFTATASSSAGTPTISYSGDCTNAGGHCVATATLAASGQYAASSATADITIQKVPTTTTVSIGAGPFTYNGSAFTATASVSPAAAGTATITYSDCTNAGTCTATATFAGNDTYEASSNTATITIDKAPTSTSASFGAGPFVYSGGAVTATASVTPAAAGTATIAYSGDCTNAGNTCSATATFAGNSNYLPSSGSAGPITIAKAATTTTVSFGSGPFIYNGSTFTATASVNPAAAGSATIAYSGQCKYAGTCTATATYAGNGNFLSSSATTSITIKYPVAATSDQCKNGGWQYLTDDLGNLFKNQGDCVSFVATKGRNKGAGGN